MDRQEFIEMLMEDKNVFVCGPSYGDTHLRVYAYGGFLAGIPMEPEDRPVRFSAGFIKYADENRDSLCDAFYIAERKAKKSGKEQLYYKYIYDDNSFDVQKWYDAVKNNLQSLLKAFDKRFSSGSRKQERSLQTIIAHKHSDFEKNGGVVVCDFESCVPISLYSESENAITGQGVSENARQGQAECDLLALKLPEKEYENAVLSMIEYKCKKSSCDTGNATLYKHAKDMIACEKIGEEYKKEIVRRFAAMCAMKGVLSNLPSNLKDTLEALKNGSMDIDIQKCFLFTKGPGLDAGSVVEICQSQLNDLGLENFRYQYRDDPKKVDLSKMRSWKKFKDNPAN